MTVTIKYHSQFADHTISSYTQQWATAYGDLVQASNIDELYYFFSDIDANDNNEIVLAGFKSPYQSEAIIIGGTLLGDNGRMGIDNYIQSLEFGESLISNTDNTAKQLEQVQLRFDGLEIEGDFYHSACSLSRAIHAEPGKPYQDGADQGTYNLLRGNADSMLELLKAQGVDINTPLKDMAIASQLDTTSEMMADAPIIDTIGSYDSAEILMAA